jgi:hypothetical protein
MNQTADAALLAEGKTAGPFEKVVADLSRSRKRYNKPNLRYVGGSGLLTPVMSMSID